jgi:DNA-binding transcriptional regulator GbsR (MarR family)
MLEAELKEELPYFEAFFSKIGFKRIDGAIYGLLVLSPEFLTSEEIEKELKLSQSAISLSLKTLSTYGIISERETIKGRSKAHGPKVDSLNIAASIFRKREQENIEQFKFMAYRVQKKLAKNIEGPWHLSKRVQRFESIVSTCEIAEAVMDMVIDISKMSHLEAYKGIQRNLPKVMKGLSKNLENISQFATNDLGVWWKRFKDKLPQNMEKH